MLRQRLKNLILTAILTFSLVSPALGDSLVQGELIDQAERHLALLDQGLYLEAWAETSPHFQSLTNQQEWLGKHHLIRNSYGPLISRGLYHTGFRETYEHSPDGQYIIIQFNSSFSDKAEARETLIYDCSSNSGSCMVRDYILQ